jgi:hypothetical protein
MLSIVHCVPCLYLRDMKAISRANIVAFAGIPNDSLVVHLTDFGNARSIIMSRLEQRGKVAYSFTAHGLALDLDEQRVIKYEDSLVTWPRSTVPCGRGCGWALETVLSLSRSSVRCSGFLEETHCYFVWEGFRGWQRRVIPASRCRSTVHRSRT